MSLGLVLSLASLALVDSTSIGTLFIPVWLLLAPGRVRVGRVLVYLATITVFYFAVGLLVVYGAGSLADAAGGVLNSRAALWVQLFVGVGLFLLSYRIDPNRRDKKENGGNARWRERAMSASSSAGWLVGLALLAGLAEVATMLPYLGAIGMMTTSNLGAALVATLLAGYCLVMVAPAGALLTARVVSQARVEPILQRLNDWISSKGASATSWIVGIAGFLIAANAVAWLFYPEWMASKR
ncbi:GAP family protein [Streptoalloteichus hindustanus]|uniref:Sap, sulfolipid-1-addressing protein n=1 Tax=Streptoalloteichus hindustanus TaxID=2017 RepID=A0A1M5MRL7_STRHI|nr:GAP family protein [Streptoalloteichus hindustanus]SHG79443.1 Sap, sulfolipid-1-addressing protein [Streptoalloteichus hindustanus]